MARENPPGFVENVFYSPETEEKIPSVFPALLILQARARSCQEQIIPISIDEEMNHSRYF